MVSLFIFLILVFILFELYFFSFKIEREKFTEDQSMTIILMEIY